MDSVKLGKGLTELPNPYDMLKFYRPKIYTLSNFMGYSASLPHLAFPKLKVVILKRKKYYRAIFSCNLVSYMFPNVF